MAASPSYKHPGIVGTKERQRKIKGGRGKVIRSLPVTVRARRNISAKRETELRALIDKHEAEFYKMVADWWADIPEVSTGP